MEGLAGMTSFLFAYGLADWRPWGRSCTRANLYVEATTMTMAGIVMAQVGAGMAWRTNRSRLLRKAILRNARPSERRGSRVAARCATVSFGFNAKGGRYRWQTTASIA
jgi:hypothetical protein